MSYTSTPPLARLAPAKRKAPPWYTTNLFRRVVHHTLVYLVLCAGAVTFVAPFLWMVTTSLKTQQHLFNMPPQWIPNPARLANYPEAWGVLPFSLFLRNTLIITLHNVLAMVISSSFVAYSFGRLRARWRDALFLLVLATMMVPYEVTMVPVFVLWSKIKLTNTFIPLMLGSWFGSPYYIFLLRQFFMSVPYDLDDAARIDGCTNWQIYRRIIMPLAKPALAAVAIFTFVGNWNDFLGPLIYLNSMSRYTLAVGLNMMRNQQYGTRIDYLMAVSTLTVLPVIVLYFSAQKYFIQGVTLTGIKG